MLCVVVDIFAGLEFISSVQLTSCNVWKKISRGGKVKKVEGNTRAPLKLLFLPRGADVRRENEGSDVGLIVCAECAECAER